MRSLYYVTTIRGMPIRVHYTWLVVVLLGIPVLTNVTIPAYMPELGGLARLALALIVLALFCLVVGIHELAHLLTARLFKVRIPTLNVYPLGAVARLSSRHSNAKAAFWAAAAGPVASIALWWLLNSITSTTIVAAWLAVILGIVGQLSLYLGLINLIPGLPLDGGRMLRAVLWGLSGSFESATKIARIAGQLGAYGLMFWGALTLTRETDWLLAGAMIVVGWAIREAGGTAYRRSLVAQHLRQLTAADVLTEPKRAVGPEQTLRSFALMLRGRTGNAPTPVIANNMFLGMLDRDRLREVPQGHWDTRTVAETMLPAAALSAIAPSTPVSMLIPRLLHGLREERNIPLPVVQEGRLLGVIDSDEMLSILEIEEEFGLFERSARERSNALLAEAASGTRQPATPRLP